MFAIALAAALIAQAPTVPAKAAPQAATDAYGFGAWLNAQRAARGLRPLIYDPNLTAYAAANSSRGFGHNGLGGYPMGSPYVRRENVGFGPGPSVWGLWLRDRPHAAALFDPTASYFGIACVGNVWTYSAR